MSYNNKKFWAVRASLVKKGKWKGSLGEKDKQYWDLYEGKPNHPRNAVNLKGDRKRSYTQAGLDDFFEEQPSTSKQSRQEGKCLKFLQNILLK